MAKKDKDDYRNFKNTIKQYNLMRYDMGYKSPMGISQVLTLIADAIAEKDVGVYNMFIEWCIKFPEIGKDLGFEYPEGM